MTHVTATILCVATNLLPGANDTAGKGQMTDNVIASSPATFYRPNASATSLAMAAHCHNRCG